MSPAQKRRIDCEPPSTIIESNNGVCHVRCTHESQEKWSQYISLINAYNLLKSQNALKLWGSMTWTILEDPASDGATIFELIKRYIQWVEMEGVREVEGRDPSSRKWEIFPSYHFFIHGDKAGMDSLPKDAETAEDAQDGAYLSLMVSEYEVTRRFEEEGSEEEAAETFDAGEEEVLGVLTKRFAGNDLVYFFARVLDSDSFGWLIYGKNGLVENY